MSEKILFTVVRNEAPYLLEWVAYHRLIGFDTIVVYSNNCTDRTDQLCAELAAEGYIEHHICDPQGASPQGHAAWMFRRSGRVKEGDWLLFCDPDEFLNVKFGGHRLDDLLERTQDAKGVLLPWRLFGDAGHLHFTGRSIDPVYSRAAPAMNANNRVVKTLVRYGPDVEFTGIHMPKMRPEYWSNGPLFLSPRLLPIDPDKPAYSLWREKGQAVTCDKDDTTYENVQINHYFVRSLASFALKHLRGNGGTSAARSDVNKQRYSSENYEKSNHNEVEDHSILIWRSQLDTAIQNMLSAQKIAQAQNMVWLDYLQFEKAFLTENGLPARIM